tara:strand:+ start:18766 stop:19437 length:672 start_codon:yes stop_codon:yes gene_type:complete
MADVTNAINEYRSSYGGSNLSDPSYYSSSRLLNLSSASNSISQAIGPTITTIPFTLVYQDTIGLFGAENFYVKITLDIIDTGNTHTTVNQYQGLTIQTDVALENTYHKAYEDEASDLSTVNTFEPSVRGAGFAELIEPVLSLEMENTGTGNMYVDRHVDARLYDINYNEVDLDTALVNKQSVFYLGIHARNTRRLPYNINLKIGETVNLRSELNEEQERSILP